MTDSSFLSYSSLPGRMVSRSYRAWCRLVPYCFKDVRQKGECFNEGLSVDIVDGICLDFLR